MTYLSKSPLQMLLFHCFELLILQHLLKYAMMNRLLTICLKKHSTGLQPGSNQTVWRRRIQFERQNYNFYTLLKATKVPGNYDSFTGHTSIACSIRIQNISLITWQSLSVSRVTNWYRMCCPSSHTRAVSICTSNCITNTGLKYDYLQSQTYILSYQQSTCSFYPILQTAFDCFKITNSQYGILVSL